MVKKRIIVHFGSGRRTPGYGMPLHNGEFHLVYDSLKALRQTYQDRTIPGVVHLFTKSAESTGLKAETAHEVHMHNVLGDLGSENEKIRLLREAARIVHPKGAIYIGETFTPEFFGDRNLSLFPSSFKLVKKIAKHLRLKCEVLAAKDVAVDRLFTVDELDLFERYTGHSAVSGDAYLLRLRKK